MKNELKPVPLVVSVFASLMGVWIACTAGLTVRCSDNQLVVDLGRGIIMEAVAIPAGSFTMGSEKGREDEKPVHKVTITKPFYMGKYKVTQEQWRAVMGDNPSFYKGDKYPVGNVSWNDCEVFLAKLNEKLNGWKASLPTEAQWEYACRAGTTTKFFCGDDECRLGEYAWFKSNAGGTTHPVGLKKPNAWGLYDTSGNVWEWCSDWYGPYPGEPQKDPHVSECINGALLYDRVVSIDPQKDPHGSKRIKFGRVLRAGSFERLTVEEKNRLKVAITSSNATSVATLDVDDYPDSSPGDLASGARCYGLPGLRFRNCGLRVVLTVVEPAPPERPR